MAKRHPLMPKVWSSHEFYDLRIGMGDILKRWDGSKPPCSPDQSTMGWVTK